MEINTREYHLVIGSSSDLKEFTKILEANGIVEDIPYKEDISSIGICNKTKTYDCLNLDQYEADYERPFSIPKDMSELLKIYPATTIEAAPTEGKV